MKASIIALLLFILGFSTISIADEKTQKPLWEIGFAGAVVSMPHYVGSDQRYILPLAFPYIIYRGKILRADRNGVRGRLLEIDRLSLDLDFSFGLPVKSDNNDARKGMPSLHLVGQMGPQLNWIMQQNEKQKVSLHFPVRFAMDTSQNYLGWVSEPSLRFERYDLMPEREKLILRLEGGLMYASQRYNSYYYGVAPLYTTATRPTFVAKKGLHSYFLDTALRYRIDKNLSMGLMVRMRMLSGSVNASSPLVRKNFYLSTGVGFVWSFLNSKETVER